MDLSRKYHNHTLQTKPRHREEEPQNTNSHATSGRQLKQGKQLLLPRQDDLKLERTQSDAQQNKDQTQNPNKQWEV